MNPALLDPTLLTGSAPNTFSVELETTKGSFVIDVNREDAPRGADRFFGLVSIGYFDGIAFFRVVRDFVAQAGIHNDPAINKVWKKARFLDDPVVGSNLAGTVTFATSGKDSRTTQFFINLKDNPRLDAMGFAPFGAVRDLEPVRALHAEYGESIPAGTGPLQGRLQREGDAYLQAEYPELDRIVRARLT